MKIDVLLELVRDSADYRCLMASLERGSAQSLVIEGAKPYVLAALFRELKRPMLVISSQHGKVSKLAEQLMGWLGAETITHIAESGNLLCTRASSDAVTSLDHLQALSRLVQPISDATPPLILTSAAALMQKLPAVSAFRSGWMALHRGMEIAPLKLVEQLSLFGYRNDALVEIPGSYSRRGDILDVYPPTEEFPIRMEFFGNTVERMRCFDTLSQCSLKAVDKLSVGPASEMAAHFTGGIHNLHKAIAGLNLSSLNP